VGGRSAPSPMRAPIGVDGRARRRRQMRMSGGLRTCHDGRHGPGVRPGLREARGSLGDRRRGPVMSGWRPTAWATGGSMARPLPTWSMTSLASCSTTRASPSAHSDVSGGTVTVPGRRTTAGIAPLAHYFHAEARVAWQLLRMGSSWSVVRSGGKVIERCGVAPGRPARTSGLAGTGGRGSGVMGGRFPGAG
jgi:hypothetical protein